MIIRTDENPKRCRILRQDLMWKYGYAYGTIYANETHWRIVQWDDKNEPSLSLNTDIRILCEKKIVGTKTQDWLFPKPFVLGDESPGGLFFGLIGETNPKALIQWDEGDFELIDPEKILIIIEEWSK